MKPDAPRFTRATGDLFGGAVAISGDTVVVGAREDDSTATGVNGEHNGISAAAGAAYVFVRTAGGWTQQAYLKPANVGATQQGDQFGFSVAISGDTVAVGAPAEDSSTVGVASTPNENAADSGAAYVFVRSGTAWSQQAYFKPVNIGASHAGDLFGSSVAISGDTLVAGSPREDSSSTGAGSTANELAADAGAATATGAAHVFERSGTLWTKQALLTSPNLPAAAEQFGFSVAVSGDLVIAGEPLEDNGIPGSSGGGPGDGIDAGAAFVFARIDTTWTMEAQLKPSDVALSLHQEGDLFGVSVAVSGDTVVVGARQEDSSTTGVDSQSDSLAPNAGAAYVFVRNGNAWSQQAYLKPASVGNTQAGDSFGISVAIAGDTVIVGATDEDSSTTGVNSAPNELASLAGAAYVFVRSGTTWSQQAYLKASGTQSGDLFGISVAVAGDTVVVGAYGEDSSSTGVNSTPSYTVSQSGAAYVFTRSGTAWSQQAYLKPVAVGTTQAGDQFGISVAVSGNTVVVGANGEDSGSAGANSAANESAANAGAAYVFVRSGITWTQQSYLKPSGSGTTQAGDEFGTSVSIAGDTIAVGAPKEDSNTTEVNAQRNELSTDSGAVWVFTRSGTAWTQQAHLKPAAVGTTQEGDLFGYFVSIAGDTVVIGAPLEDSGSTGVNGAPDESAANSGAAYVFTRNGTNWAQQAYLKPTDVGITQAGDFLGNSVAVAGDTVIAGAPLEDGSTPEGNAAPNEKAFGAGAAGIFTRSGATWTPQAQIKAALPAPLQALDGFGSSVAVSRDTAVVGAPGEDSSTLGVNSSTTNETAPGAGAAYVFVRTAEGWRQQAYLKPAAVGTKQSGDQFGAAVAISGDSLIVGAPGEGSDTTGVNGAPNEILLGSASGAAYVFTRSGATWTQQAFLKPAAIGTLQAEDAFGTSVAIENNTVIVGAPKEDSDTLGVNTTPNESAINSGAAYVFVRSGTAWTQQAYLKPAAAGSSQAGDGFGSSVAISIDTVVVGAPLEDSDILGVNSPANQAANDSGAAYVFMRSGTAWTQQAFLKPAAVGADQTSDAFGTSVGVSGDTVVVGAPGEDSDSLGVNSTPRELPLFAFGDSGAAYIFTRRGTAWTQQAYLKPSAVGTTQTGDRFGTSVAISDQTVVIGSPGEDGSATGVNSPPDDGLTESSGAAYVFMRRGTVWMQQAYLKPALVGTGTLFDFFGSSVAVAGDMVIIGAPQEDSSSAGVNSTPNDASTDAGAACLFSTPRLVVEQPAGFSAGSTVDFATIVAGAGSATLTFTVRNVGLDPLTLFSTGVTGGQAGNFAVNTAGMLSSLPGGGTTTFTVSFSLAATGSRTTTLRIVSDDATEGPFDLTLTGTAVSFATDTDGDGMNDASEVQLAALGFDWQVNQAALVATLSSNTAGLQPNLNAAGFFTTGQIQALSPGLRFLPRNPASGQFALELSLEKSADLTTFTPFQFLAPQTTVRPDGKIEFLFSVPDNTALFRLESR